MMDQPLQQAVPYFYSQFEAFRFRDLMHPVHRQALALELLAIHVAFALNACDPFPIQAPAFVYIEFDDEQFQLQIK